MGGLLSSARSPGSLAFLWTARWFTSSYPSHLHPQLSCSSSGFSSPIASLRGFFDVSKEAWNVIDLSFSNVLFRLWCLITATHWEDQVKEKWGFIRPSPGLMNNLSSATFSHLCQECGLNSMSSLPLTFQDTCQVCCLDTWQNIGLRFTLALDMKWHNPQLNSVATWTSIFF